VLSTLWISPNLCNACVCLPLVTFTQAYEHEKRTKAIFSALLPENHPRVQDSMVWLNAFTRNAVQVAKGGAPTSFMEHGTPFTWISLRSTMPFKGRITMGDMLQVRMVQVS